MKRKKTELEEIRKYKLQGALIRSRWQNNCVGEKPSKIFLNLENKNFVSKHIRELKTDKKVLRDPSDILEEMRRYYENLYKKQNNRDIETTSLSKINERLPKLNNKDRELLEKDITIEELAQIVKKSKNNKSPGPDGFTNEFYKIFWANIRFILLQLIKSYRENKILNPRQLDGVITCIPKGGKLRNNLKNWRPITLLNSIYKFYSSTIAERIKIILPKLIHSDQKGFINGRFIGENTRITYDIIQECNLQKINGLILLIDFEKAFDSISWEFIAKTLKIFDFGIDTINWIKSLQIGSTSKILQNGNFSNTIPLGRGCRQGDPVSPYIFVLAAEILSEAIRDNKNIEGITIFQKEQKVSQYADDTTLFIKANERNIRYCMLTLGEFEEVSGLKVNKEKTKVVKIGEWRDNGTILCEDLKLDWSQEFVSLGITYDIKDFENITERNIDIKLKEIHKLIQIWNGRFLTPFGKVVIIKSLLISKITHVLLSLPSPKPDTIIQIEETFKNFLWNNKIPKFRKEILETLSNLGGLKLTNLQKFDSALKISWIKRLMNQKEGWAIFPMQYGFGNILRYGDKYQEMVIKNTINKFWKDTAKAINELYNTLTYNNTNQIYNAPLWHNSKFEIPYRREWEEKGFHIISDILDEEGNLLTERELNVQGVKINFLDYHTMVKRWKNLTRGCTLKSKITGPFLPRILFEVGIATKGCNIIYNKLMVYNSNILIEVKNKWERVLNEEISYNSIENSFIAIPKMIEGPYQKYFQFRLLHSRIVTNKKLHVMKISDTNLCPICYETEETIKHAFLECQFVIILWNQIECWCKNITDRMIKINEIEKIFGSNPPDKIIDKVIMCTKLVIYNNRKTGKKHHINEVKRMVYSQLNLEEYHAKLMLKETEFQEIWGRVYNELANMF